MVRLVTQGARRRHSYLQPTERGSDRIRDLIGARKVGQANRLHGSGDACRGYLVDVDAEGAAVAFGASGLHDRAHRIATGPELADVFGEIVEILATCHDGGGAVR